MAIDLTQDLTKLAKRDARRASQKGLVVQSVKLDLLNHSHIQILKEFMLVHEVDPLNRALISTLNAHLRDPDTYVLEVWHDNTLVGFATLSLTFSTRPFFTLAFYHPNVKFASDAVMHYAWEFCKQRGYQELGIGFVDGEGTYNYKKNGELERQALPITVFFTFEMDRARVLLPGISFTLTLKTAPTIYS